MTGKRNRNRDRGKAHQKKTAEALGMLNVGTLSGEDLYHQTFSGECKSTAKFVGRKWYAQAEKNAHGKIPFICVHETGTPYEKDLVMLSLQHFKELLFPVVPVLPMETEVAP